MTCLPCPESPGRAGGTEPERYPMPSAWDSEEAVSRYEDWYKTPKGSFALDREKLLLTQLMSPWPRRGSSMLELGCGAGHFLELFWDSGFDVTGLDNSQPMLDAARKRMGHRAALELGNAEYLPFEDGAFDYVVLVTALECMDEPEIVLEEAFRVASKGVLVAFLNSWSLHWAEKNIYGILCRCLPKKWRPTAPPAKQARWFSPLKIGRMLRAASDKRPLTFRSALFAPSVFWRKKESRCCINWWSVLPFGAVVAARVDISPVCVTPRIIPVRNTASAIQ